MTFSDFLDNFKSTEFFSNATAFEPLEMLIALGLAVGLGLFIFFVYKHTYNGVMYSFSFGASLVAMTLVTTFVILAVTSNVVLSLSMLGALSIVRFRAAVKEPLDVTFIFWAIAAGIVLGAGLIPLAICGSLFIGAILIIFVRKGNIDRPYVIVICCDNEDAEKKALEIVSKSVKKSIVKAKAVSATGIELNVEIRLHGSDTSFINELSETDGVQSAVMVSLGEEYITED